MTERILSQEQVEKMFFLRKVQGVTLRDKVHRSEIRKAQNIKPLLRIERSQLRWFGNVSRISQKRLARQVLLAISGPPRAAAPATLPKGKAGRKMNE